MIGGAGEIGMGGEGGKMEGARRRDAALHDGRGVEKTERTRISKHSSGRKRQRR